jgi:hypothetical protein
MSEDYEAANDVQQIQCMPRATEMRFLDRFAAS